jgi:hypothetical protein
MLVFDKEDEVVDSECSKARPDFVYHLGDLVIITEVDEGQHKGYKSCGHTKEERMATEKRRMFGIFQSYYGVPTVFVRYNPDSFRDDNGKIVKVGDMKRQEVLISWLKKIMKEKKDFTGCNVKYLFYDGYSEGDESFQKLNEEDVA